MLALLWALLTVLAFAALCARPPSGDRVALVLAAARVWAVIALLALPLLLRS